MRQMGDGFCLGQRDSGVVLEYQGLLGDYLVGSWLCYWSVAHRRRVWARDRDMKGSRQNRG